MEKVYKFTRYKGRINYGEDERDHIENLELITNKMLKENLLAKDINFYGARLRFLISFYNRRYDEIAKVLLTSKSTLSYWVRNIEKPSTSQVRQMCMFFEVPERFFTEDTIEIKINEQLKITMK